MKTALAITCWVAVVSICLNVVLLILIIPAINKERKELRQKVKTLYGWMESVGAQIKNKGGL